MKILTFIIYLFATVSTFSQNNLEFEFDYAQFGYDASSNYLEIYYSFNQSSMTISHKDTIDYTRGVLHVLIVDSISKEIIVDNNWLISHTVSDDQIMNKSLVGVVGFVLKEGIYNCKIIGYDAADSMKNRSISESILVKPFYVSEISLSDIQLASNVVKGSDNQSSIFYKNTYEVIPIPIAIFGKQQPVLFYYTELYSLAGISSEYPLRLDKQVINSRGQIVLEEKKVIKRSSNSRVEVGTVMTYKLPTDKYTLVLSLIDSAASYGVSSSKKFFIYNPSVAYVDTFQTQSSSIVSGMFGVMSEEELDDFFAKSKYIATPAEIDKFESLATEDGKREFLTIFWKSRDEDPSDDINNSLKAYIKRIKESNIRFQALSKEGWKTDRGRVFLMYGEPSEIIRYPNQTETRPYEVWMYNDIEGGVQFVFGDITGFSDYTLLHSDKRGELRDDNWQRRIQVR